MDVLHCVSPFLPNILHTDSSILFHIVVVSAFSDTVLKAKLMIQHLHYLLPKHEKDNIVNISSLWSSNLANIFHKSFFTIICLCSIFFFLKDFIYLFLERGEGKEKERARNIIVWLPLVCLLLETWPTTQACALTGNRTWDLLVHSLCSIHWTIPARPFSGVL